MLQLLVVGTMATNAYIYSEDNETCFIIDPGGDHAMISSEIDTQHLVPKGIICTHGHLDHTSAVGPLLDMYTGKGLELYLAIHTEDREYLGAASENTHRKSFASLGVLDTGYFSMLFNPTSEPTVLLEDNGGVPGTSFKVIHTPGHTPGSVCFYHEADNILISGDTLFWRGIGRTDLPGGDSGKIIESLRTRLFTLPDNTHVYPGHGPETELGSEKQQNPYR